MGEKPSTKPKAPARGNAVTSRSMSAEVPLTKDKNKERVTFFLDIPVIDKLCVASRIHKCDRNDLVNKILGDALSSITFYDRSSPAPGGGPTIDSEAS